MGAARAIILAAAQNQWVERRVSRYAFVRKTVSRFMPGETLDDAIAAAHRLHSHNLGTALTHLGENVSDAREAGSVVAQYLEALERARVEHLAADISVKPTHLGLELSESLCERNLRRLLRAANPPQTVWIDMESSQYVDRTVRLYRNVLSQHSNCGICLQAYLHRTPGDLEALLPARPNIRLVKGAYAEPSVLAVQRKPEISAKYTQLAQVLLRARADGSVRRAIFATHDASRIRDITELASEAGLRRDQVELQMLYGIQSNLQLRLAEEGWRSSVLVAYGTRWYAWFMRRLAERPANLWLLFRNIAAR